MTSAKIRLLIINDLIKYLNQSRLLRGPGNARWLVRTAKAYWAIIPQWNSSILKDSCSTYIFSWHLVESSPIVKTCWQTWRLTDFSGMERQDIWSTWLQCLSTNKFGFLSLVSCLFTQCHVFATYLYLL